MTPERLSIPRAVFDAVVAHAEQALPHEAVGLLAGGPDGRVQSAEQLQNIAGPGRFLAQPYSQFRALKGIREAGLTPLAVYHSHPAGGVELSALDRAYAAKLGLVQVVIALARQWRPGVEARAYRVTEDSVFEVPLTVDGEEGAPSHQ